MSGAFVLRAGRYRIAVLVALGAALCGTRPIIEMRIADFTLCAMDELVSQIAKEDVPGLERVVDYSRFSLMAIIG